MNDALSRLRRAFERFDEVNAEDPRTVVVEGRDVPFELAYADRMTQALNRFDPDASEALRLATRAQHIARWHIPRTEYPEGRSGYRAWRTRLMAYHAELADGILEEVGYGEETRARVGGILTKRGIKRDPDAQGLEDVACLVFLEHYFDEFAAKHEDDKLVEILRKTLAKMSERGRKAALDLDLSSKALDLIERAT